MPLWRFLTLTGIRRGELGALQYRRDYNGETIMIRKCICHEGLITSGKTANAERSIYLAPLPLAQLTAPKATLRVRGKSKTIYLFCDEDGRRISPRVFMNHWQKWREAHGIELTLHELRHTFISYSRLKTNISLEDLKELYGHAKAMDTDRTYVHEIKKSPEEVRAQQEKIKNEAVIIDSTFLSILKAEKDQK